MTKDIAQAADALWRAITYVAVAQLHLDANPLLHQPLTTEHVKRRPTGHWGTVPGNAFVLSHVALLAARTEREVVPILGAGHAGVAQLAMAWLTGDLAATRPQFSLDLGGLTRLVRSFPLVDGLGAEVSPLLPAGWYLGGQIGGALAFAQGAALDSPSRVVVPVLGDGECETPTTAAAWLAAETLSGRSTVVPVVHLNGYRMGSASLLGAMDDDALRAYAAGLGWQAHVVRINDASPADHDAFHQALASATIAAPYGDKRAVFLRCVKGWSGPTQVAGRQILRTPYAHKTPIIDPRGQSQQLAELANWLASYGPRDLFGPTGVPIAALAAALNQVRGALRPQPNSFRRSTAPRRNDVRFTSFTQAVSTVLREHAAAGDILVLSPDELESNRLGELIYEPWVAEILAEEVLLGWLAGWTATGRRGVLVSYEAFATLLTTGLVQHLKHRRITQAALTWPSINLLLTSYGWHNTYTHGDPSLITALLGTRDSALRVVAPADSSRLALALDGALRSTGQVNVIIAGKHPVPNFPMDTLEEERERGLAIWPHTSDEGEPDLVIVAAGDLPATVACTAVPTVRGRLGIRVRIVNVQDLTVLGQPDVWPMGLSDPEIEHYFGASAPVLILTLGHASAVWGLIEGRLHRRVDVIGWHEPSAPMSQQALAAESRMNIDGLCLAAERLCSPKGVPV